MLSRYQYCWMRKAFFLPNFKAPAFSTKDPTLMQNTAQKVHTRARDAIYVGSKVERFKVPDDRVSWSIEWLQYNPVVYNADAIKGAVWADPDIGTPGFHPKWNCMDGTVDRTSFDGNYSIEDGMPRNPMGRTGMTGRGLLGRWGPNHAADPIVTRWKRESGILVMNNETQKPILEFVAIQRKDSGEWGIPGGMVEAGDTVSMTLKKEFMEEAMNSMQATQEEKDNMKQLLKNFFEHGTTIYSGYVDDPRNTDNAWMETVAVNFHDEDGTKVGKFPLQAGDDAGQVKWLEINSKVVLYASHKDMIQTVVKSLRAHW